MSYKQNFSNLSRYSNGGGHTLIKIIENLVKIKSGLFKFLLSCFHVI